MRMAREEKIMSSNNNPLITSNTSDTVHNIVDFLDFLCDSESNDDEGSAGKIMALRVVRGAVSSLAEKRDEK